MPLDRRVDAHRFAPRCTRELAVRVASRGRLPWAGAQLRRSLRASLPVATRGRGLVREPGEVGLAASGSSTFALFRRQIVWEAVVETRVECCSRVRRRDFRIVCRVLTVRADAAAQCGQGLSGHSTNTSRGSRTAPASSDVSGGQGGFALSCALPPYCLATTDPCRRARRVAAVNWSGSAYLLSRLGGTVRDRLESKPQRIETAAVTRPPDVEWAYRGDER